MDGNTKDTFRTVISWTAGAIAFLTGIGLCIAGVCLPPVGQIDPSVLTATGEFLTFFASIYSIEEFARFQIHKITHTKGRNSGSEEAE